MKRMWTVGFSINAKGYITTGVDSNSNRLNDLWQYNPASNTWVQKTNFQGTGRFQATGFSIGNFGYVGTGADAISYTGDFWRYDPVTDSWLQKAFGPGPRGAAIGFSIGTKGYLGTGILLNPVADFYEYTSDSVTGIESINEFSEILLSPNPFHTSLSICFKNPQRKPCTIAITNSSGQIVFSNKLRSNECSKEVKIDLGFLSTGIYYLEVKNDDFRTVKKILKI